jgi:hypothetical protein
MIAKTYILENLRQLDSAYRSSRSQKYGFYFSKLAILELCGWIEVTMDDIVIAHCGRHVTEPQNTKFFKDQVVKKNYGFNYDPHFRKMLINLIGIASCEKLEAKVPAATHAKFVAQLQSLNTVRNGLAHTYLKGRAITITIDAPSVTKARFYEIFDGLKSFEQELRKVS